VLESDGDREMKDSSVQTQRRKKSIKLIGNVVREERKHSADVAHARDLKKVQKSETFKPKSPSTSYLRAQRSFLMEISVDEVAVLLGGDATFAVHSSAAWMSDYLTHHVLGRVVF
jgi:hypothetical protein